MNEIVRISAKAADAKRVNRAFQIRKAEFSQSASSPVDRILFLQRTIGNQAVQRLIKSGNLQAKLRIGHPGDEYEQEADRVADAVMRMPNPEIISRNELHIQRSCPACDENELKRQPIKEEEEEEKLQAKTTSDRIPEIDPNIESYIQSLNGGGQPLSEDSRAFFEPRFDYDFSQVRVHTDAKAAESARVLNAQAYTVGKDVVFGGGYYSPSTQKGQKLLAHELTHVVQQTRAVPPRVLAIGQYKNSYERESKRVSSTLSNEYSYGERPFIMEVSALQASTRLQRLGANPTCTTAEADDIHQAIFDARGWLNKAIPQLEESPLSERVLASLRRNFGPTYGVASNATLIRNRLNVARGALGRIPFSCDTAGTTPLCIAQHCGWANVGSNAATICTNAPSTLGLPWPQAPACMLHESLHASMSFMTVDRYKGQPGYPGAGTDPLLNADSYTSLAMDLS